MFKSQRSESVSSSNISLKNESTIKSSQSKYSYPRYPESYEDFIPQFSGRGKQTTIMLRDFWETMEFLVEQNSTESLSSFRQTIESLPVDALIPVRITNNPKDRMLVNPWYIFAEAANEENDTMTFRPFVQQIINKNLIDFLMVIEPKIYNLKTHLPLSDEQEKIKHKYISIVQKGHRSEAFFEKRIQKNTQITAQISSYEAYVTTVVTTSPNNNKKQQTALTLADFHNQLKKHILENNADSLSLFEEMLNSLPTKDLIPIKYQGGIKNITIWDIFIKNHGDDSYAFQDFIIVALKNDRDDFLRIIFDMLENLSQETPQNTDVLTLLNNMLHSFYMPTIQNKIDQQNSLQLKIKQLTDDNEQIEESLRKRKTQQKSLTKAFSKAKDDEKNAQEQHVITLTKHDKLNDFAHTLNQEISRLSAGIYNQLDSVQTEVSISAKQIDELKAQQAQQAAELRHLITASFANQHTQPVNIHASAPVEKLQTPARKTPSPKKTTPQKIEPPIASTPPVKKVLSAKKEAEKTPDIKAKTPDMKVKTPDTKKHTPISLVKAHSGEKPASAIAHTNKVAPPKPPPPRVIAKTPSPKKGMAPPPPPPRTALVESPAKARVGALFQPNPPPLLFNADMLKQQTLKSTDQIKSVVKATVFGGTAMEAILQRGKDLNKNVTESDDDSTGSYHSTDSDNTSPTYGKK